MLPDVSMFPGLILVLKLVASVESTCSHEKIYCYCGISHQEFSVSCIDDHDEDQCEHYEHCETCENDVPHCITCPRGYFGPYCDQEEDSHHHEHDSDGTGNRFVPRGLSCPELRAPKLGSISCWYRGYEKECTGKCLPGHSFENEAEEIKLVCQSGVWLPYSSFPSCISTGSGTERAKQRVCECQNGGSCTSGNRRRCTCPPGFTGRLCEIEEYNTRRPCSQPDQVNNGEMKNPDGSTVTRSQQFYEGSSVVYSCNSEFALVGESLLTCTRYGMWSSTAPKCNSLSREKSAPPRPNLLRSCPDPGQVDHGVRKSMNKRQSNNELFFEGSSVVFSCHNGFALLGQSMLTCTSSREWSASLPTCEKIGSPPTESTDDSMAYCKDPGVDQNGIKKVSPWINPRRPNSGTGENQYPQGTRIDYTCKEGYNLQGESSITCLYSGYWSSPIPTCDPAPDTPTTDDGLVYCNDPGVPTNGIKIVSPWISPRRTNSDSDEIQYPQGTKIEYSCKQGYNSQGEKSILCLFSGLWSSPIPTCYPKPEPLTREDGKDVYCENPGDIRNGRKSILPFLDPRTKKNVIEDSADLPEGVKLVYSCDPGFSIRGSNMIECRSTGSWSSAVPTCEKEVKGCGHSYYAMAGKIFNGKTTVEGEWPWQVAYAENGRTGMSLTCGAVLIDHRTAVTAAHCVHSRRLDKTFLYFGKFYSDLSKDDDQVLSRKVTEFIIHPMYNQRNMDNDIALVRFAPEVPYNPRIQPICLPTRETSTRNMEHGAKGWVTGWGTTENGTDSDILLMAQLPVVSTIRCRNMYKRLRLAVRITNNMFCAGFDSGEVDSCSGDSGGPMVFYNRLTESYVLEGIVSFGVKGPTGSCGQQDRYGVYTKVSNYVQWIKQYT